MSGKKQSHEGMLASPHFIFQQWGESYQVFLLLHSLFSLKISRLWSTPLTSIKGSAFRLKLRFAANVQWILEFCWRFYLTSTMAKNHWSKGKTVLLWKLRLYFFKCFINMFDVIYCRPSWQKSLILSSRPRFFNIWKVYFGRTFFGEHWSTVLGVF